MSISCATSPTLTRTDEFTTQSLSTSFSLSVSTAPPTITTITSLGCATSLSLATSCNTEDTTTTQTILGAVDTVQVPFTLTVDVISSLTTTLFGESCTTIENPPPDTTPDPPPTSQDTTTTQNQPPPPPTPTPTQNPTPIPTTFTSESSSTQANGSVVVQTATVTSTLSPSASIPTNLSNSGSNNQVHNSSVSLGPVVGGAVGGFFGLIAIVLFIWFLIRRRRRWDDIFEKDDEVLSPSELGRGRNERFSLDTDAEPKPYQYGLVGHTHSPTLVSPPGSPPIAATAPSGAKAHQSSQHGQRRLSLPPLNLPMTASTPGPSLSTVSSRPSTAGSMYPLKPEQNLATPMQPQSVAFSQPQSYSSSVVPPVMLSNRSPNASSTRNSGASDDFTTLGYLDRTGSPISFQEPRRLQIANVLSDMGSPTSSVFPLDMQEAFAAVEAPRAVTPSKSSAPATIAGPGTPPPRPPRRDPRGRLSSSGATSPLVDLGGERAQQGSPRVGAASTSAYRT